MSQTITNNEGESVEVLDKSDLNAVLLKLIGFIIVVVLPLAVTGTFAVAETRRDVAELQRDIPDQKALRRTMDSLLIEMRATRRELSAWQGVQRR